MNESDIRYPEEVKHDWRSRRLAKYKAELIEVPKKIYLASPYSHKNSNIQERRFILVTYVAACLTKSGYNVYSPILNGHMMSQYIEFPGDYNFWKTRDEQFIKFSDEFWILKLTDWKLSTGITRELAKAKLLEKPRVSVYLQSSLSERELCMELMFWKVNRVFSDKFDLQIITTGEV